MNIEIVKHPDTIRVSRQDIYALVEKAIKEKTGKDAIVNELGFQYDSVNNTQYFIFKIK